MAMSKAKRPHANKEKASVSDIKAETALQGDEFYQMVSEAAYYRAENRGFAAGQEMDDWIAAEAEILELQKEREVA